jgi:hypothetical protein
MTVSVLESAILAMDVYNRNGGLNLSGGIGNFQIGDPSPGGGSFYAQSYTNGSDTVISYRGSDGPGDVFTVLTASPL